MAHICRVPNNLLDQSAYANLSPKDKPVYMEDALQEILALNKDIGVTIPQLVESTPFSRKGVSKYLEKLVAQRIAYNLSQY